MTLIDSASPQPMKTKFPNCEQLHKDLQIRWSTHGPSITMELAAQIGTWEVPAAHIDMWLKLAAQTGTQHAFAVQMDLYRSWRESDGMQHIMAARIAG